MADADYGMCCDRNGDDRFGSGSHTAVSVPAFSYGAGSDRLTGMMDNITLAWRIMELLGLE